VGAQSKPKKKTQYVVVGSSNARRTSKALESAGITVHLIFKPNWRIGKESCEQLGAQLAAAVGDLDPEVIVLQLFDASCFFARMDDGSRMMPKKQADGRFHIQGELVVCPGETQLELLNTMKLVLDAVGNKLAIFITPLPRYITAGCCDDPAHVSNREDRHFRADMNLQLDGLRRAVKNFLFNTGRRSIRILDTAMVIRGLEDADLWCTDPVHPIESVYARIAEGVTSMVAKLGNGFGGGGGVGGGGGIGGTSGRGRSGRDAGGHGCGRWGDEGERGCGRGQASWSVWHMGRDQRGRGGRGEHHGRGGPASRWNSSGSRGRPWSAHQKRRREEEEEEEAEYDRHRSNQRYMAHGHINRGGRRGRQMY
jgi:hypothetical protein